MCRPSMTSGACDFPLGELYVSEDALAAMIDEARRLHPNEAGGVLVGVSVSGRPWVTHAVPIPSAVRSNRGYELPDNAGPAAVDQLRRCDRRLGYLGDWHSHPEDIAASPEDVDSLRRIIARAGAGPRPVLAVVRHSTTHHSVDFLVVDRSRARSMRTVRTGALTPVSPAGRLARLRRLPGDLVRRFRPGANDGRNS